MTCVTSNPHQSPDKEEQPHFAQEEIKVQGFIQPTLPLQSWHWTCPASHRVSHLPSATLIALPSATPIALPSDIKRATVF